MKKENILSAIIIVIVFTLVIITFVSGLIWADSRTDKLMESAEVYEECIMNQYNTTPSAYYNENGEYPYCEKINS